MKMRNRINIVCLAGNNNSFYLALITIIVWLTMACTFYLERCIYNAIFLLSIYLWLFITGKYVLILHSYASIRWHQYDKTQLNELWYIDQIFSPRYFILPIMLQNFDFVLYSHWIFYLFMMPIEDLKNPISCCFWYSKLSFSDC